MKLEISENHNGTRNLGSASYRCGYTRVLTVIDFFSICSLLSSLKLKLRLY